MLSYPSKFHRTQPGTSCTPSAIRFARMSTVNVLTMMRFWERCGKTRESRDTPSPMAIPAKMNHPRYQNGSRRAL